MRMEMRLRTRNINVIQNRSQCLRMRNKDTHLRSQLTIDPLYILCSPCN